MKSSWSHCSPCSQCFQGMTSSITALTACSMVFRTFIYIFNYVRSVKGILVYRDRLRAILKATANKSAEIQTQLCSKYIAESH